jgi:PBP1b-binding outer membrane lipoprotein LpoB
MNFKLSLVSVLFLAGCASKPILEKEDIKVTRDKPSESCQDLGAIEGRVTSLKGTIEQAMEDLKSEAVKKGADFVQVETIGAQSSIVRGRAYNCN